MQREIYILTLGRGLTVPLSSHTIIILYAWNSIHGLIHLGAAQTQVLYNRLVKIMKIIDHCDTYRTRILNAAYFAVSNPILAYVF
jgi:hypothetical protein